MTTPTSAAKHVRRRSLFRRILLWSVGAGALVIVAALAISMSASYAARNRLVTVISKLDHADPNWRLEDLDKDLTALPDERNSAVLIQQILKNKPANWPSQRVLWRAGQFSPTEWLDPDVSKDLKSDWARSPETIRLVRKLADLDQGHAKVHWAIDPTDSVLASIRQTGEIIPIARYDAVLRMEEANFDGALESSRAILIAGRGNDSCKSTMTMVIRLNVGAVCLSEVEGALAKGEASDAALKAMQGLLENELAQPFLLQSLRGERAICYSTIDANKADARRVALMDIGSAWAAETDLWSKIQSIVQSPFMGAIEANESFCLESMSDLMGAMKQPESEQQAAFERVEALSLDWRQPALFRTMMPTVAGLRQTYTRWQARFRTTIVAIAAERYRRKQGRWPQKLEELIPAELAEVPTDPYDGKPLRLKQLPDGFIVYSVGFNGIDDGGAVTSIVGKTADTGFRLWDANQRGKKPTANLR
jgi:hypothetical protein